MGKSMKNFILDEVEKYNKSIMDDIKKESRFRAAEEYHQNYLIKNPGK
jgi:peptide methionine sulfoxide reductase MsrA